MTYTVKELSELSGVTIKALHHYHRIGLLPPRATSQAGYRLYGDEELKRLQLILFYKELDFPLEKIRTLLDGKPERLAILADQRELVLARRERLERVLRTLDESIGAETAGEALEPAHLFEGFRTEAEWAEALEPQRQYLKETYGFDPADGRTIDPEAINRQAREAAWFMTELADCLREGAAHSEPRVRELIRAHLASRADEEGTKTDAAAFAAQARFFLDDAFHRAMLESQQTGLAYYLCAAAESFAAGEAAGRAAER